MQVNPPGKTWIFPPHLERSPQRTACWEQRRSKDSLRFGDLEDPKADLTTREILDFIVQYPHVNLPPASKAVLFHLVQCQGANFESFIKVSPSEIADVLGEEESGWTRQRVSGIIHKILAAPPLNYVETKRGCLASDAWEIRLSPQLAERVRTRNAPYILQPEIALFLNDLDTTSSLYEGLAPERKKERQRMVGLFKKLIQVLRLNFTEDRLLYSLPEIGLLQGQDAVLIDLFQRKGFLEGIGSMPKRYRLSHRYQEIPKQQVNAALSPKQCLLLSALVRCDVNDKVPVQVTLERLYQALPKSTRPSSARSLHRLLQEHLLRPGLLLKERIEGKAYSNAYRLAVSPEALSKRGFKLPREKSGPAVG